MRKATTASGLTLMLALALSSGIHAQDVPAAFDQVARSVVEVRGEHLVMTGTTEKQTTVVTSQGSGVLVSSDGKVITGAHLVQSADAITVRTGTGDGIPARVIASEPAADVALLQLERLPTGATPAVLGNSTKSKQGSRFSSLARPTDSTQR